MRALLILLLLSTFCRGELLELRVASYPPDVSFYRPGPGAGEPWLLVGKSPLQIDSSWFSSSGSLTLQGRAPGYQSQNLNLFRENLSQKEIRMEMVPLTSWVWLRDRARYHPLGLLVIAIPLAVASGLVWLALWARRRRLAAAQSLEALRTFQADLQADGSDPHLGRHFGPYVLTERLGMGGMGCVYRASGPDGEVALKLVRPEYSGDEEFRNRFWREIKLAGKLNHKSIVRILSCDVQDGILYYVMELIAGRDLSTRIGPSGWAVPDALAVFLPILDAMQAAHKAGIVHRDLKPSNILLENSGRVVLMDFGLAKSSDSPPLTATGAALGTPAYMAPEQIMGKLDKRSDQYSLGIILYELLTGRRPFLESDMSVIWKHVSSDIPSPRDFRADLPPSVEAVLLRMLSKDPDQRFEELADVRVALEGL